MDKSMKRVVGYDKKKDEAQAPAIKPTAANEKDKKPTPKEKPPKPEPPKPALADSPSVIAWLTAHPLIKVKAVCDMAGVDPGNFHRQVKVKKEIPKEVLSKIIPILKEYGF